MLFNSFEFAIFFPIVFALYLVLGHTGRNRMLLVASYVFYGWWDWRFLSLIILSTLTDYYCGLRIGEAVDETRRKFFLTVSVCMNLGILGFFKYFDFFLENFKALLTSLGVATNLDTLGIILPVGISFYTFQTMSYTIDIYRREMEPTHRFFDFALFVSFFPQLVAGPIERAKQLLPQILAPRVVTWQKVQEGAYLILWGLFMKMFVADNLAKLVDPVFAAEAPQSGVQVLLALYAFAFQIFCDFAGYSEIARGLAKCLGIELMVNFNLPYFATTPSEFWRRWHISLSQWLRDYLYIPLGGNRDGTFMTYRNLSLTMLLGGLWHGAAWTFVFWGAYQGALLVVHRLAKPFLKSLPEIRSRAFATAWWMLRVAVFFQFVCIGWLLFRAQSMHQVGQMLHSIFFNFHLEGFDFVSMVRKMTIYLAVLLPINAVQYQSRDLMAPNRWRPAFLAIFQAVMLYLLIFHTSSEREFIYFEF